MAEPPMRVITAPPVECVKSAEGVSLKKWLQDELVVSPETEFALIKGYGNGLPNRDYHPDALSLLTKYRVLLWDGDWEKDESFTSLVRPFLAGDPSRRAVAFRKAEGSLEGFSKSWSSCPHVDQMVLALVPAPYIAESRSELLELGISEEHLDNTALGWVTIRFTETSHVLAVGGGLTTVNEAKACLAARQLKPRATQASWSVLNMGRKTKNGDEWPEELIAIAQPLLPTKVELLLAGQKAMTASEFSLHVDSYVGEMQKLEAEIRDLEAKVRQKDA